MLLMHRLGCRLLTGGLERNHLAAVRNAFHWWREVVLASAETDRQHKVVRRVAQRLALNRTARAFTRWVEYRHERQRMKGQVVGVSCKIFLEAGS
jgi:hypothetical protein